MPLIQDLTPEQDARIGAHAQRWAEIALRTGSADRAAFEEAARRCYRYGQVRWPGRVIWVSSPLVLALASAAAVCIIQLRSRGCRVPPNTINEVVAPLLGGHEAEPVCCAVQRAVEEAVDEAVSAAMANVKRIPGCRELSSQLLSRMKYEVYGSTSRPRIEAEVDDKVFRALEAQVDREVFVHVETQMRAAGLWRAAVAVSEGVEDAVSAVMDRAVDLYGFEGRTVPEVIWDALSEIAADIFGGQLVRRGEAWGCRLTSFFREVCGIGLEGNLWDRSRAFEAAAHSACWWYPHHGFLMVCERPLKIHHAQLSPARHGLHCTGGPAVLWGDGWGIYAFNGRRMPAWVIENPESISVKSIEEERNTEVRRAMLERYGWSRFISDCGANVIDCAPADHPIAGLRGARLLSKHLSGEREPIVFLEMVNSTPQPDGSFARYLERIDPKAYNWDASDNCHAAMASRWYYRDWQGRLQRTFERWQDYQPSAES